MCGVCVHAPTYALVCIHPGHEPRRYADAPQMADIEGQRVLPRVPRGAGHRVLGVPPLDTVSKIRRLEHQLRSSVGVCAIWTDTAQDRDKELPRVCNSHGRLQRLVFAEFPLEPFPSGVSDPVVAVASIIVLEEIALFERFQASSQSLLAEGDLLLLSEVVEQRSRWKSDVVLREEAEYRHVAFPRRHHIVSHSASHYFRRYHAYEKCIVQTPSAFPICPELWTNVIREGFLVRGNDHASGSTRVRSEKKAGLPPRRESGVWSNSRPMECFERCRLKTQGGVTTAQTPSTSASAPDQIGTLAGADTLSSTATNQSTRTGAVSGQTTGGGRCAAL